MPEILVPKCFKPIFEGEQLNDLLKSGRISGKSKNAYILAGTTAGERPNEDIYTISVIKDVKMLLYIEHDFLIENNTSLEFMIGKVSIIINSPKDENDEKFHIEIEGKTYTYYKKKDLPITIGRVNTRKIIKNTSISKVHSIIEYNDENNTLSIRDNNSTNGTYFVLGNRYPFIYILSDLTLKILDSKFTIKLHEN